MLKWYQRKGGGTMFDPYYNFLQYQNPYPNQYPNSIPAQRIIQVNGKASIDTLKMAPNSSVLLMDTTAPIVWMCVSDGVGRVVATPYDITEHKSEPAASSSDLEARVSNIEVIVSQLEGKVNVLKSNVGKLEPKQSNE